MGRGHKDWHTGLHQLGENWDSQLESSAIAWLNRDIYFIPHVASADVARTFKSVGKHTISISTCAGLQGTICALYFMVKKAQQMTIVTFLFLQISWTFFF